MIDTVQSLRLDDLYKMTAHIYGDRNSARSREATFAHFVEVCGMLTVHDRRKRREQFSLTDALCKALGWYFPLLAKARVESVERLVFRKFPGVCPYCRQAPHNEGSCKLVKGTASTVNHSEVLQMYERNWDKRPTRLNEWQSMFNRIYPRQLSENARSSVALLEELGELAEAIRVFDAHPHYFLGEAADTFSYIMGIANEHLIREQQEDQQFSFEREYLTRYPGLCMQCGSKICICPSIPAATVGRMAKELIIQPGETPFISNADEFTKQGKRAAQVALENAGGYAGLVEKLPFDRGDANRSLVQLCLKIASVVEKSTQTLAEMLRAEALKLGEHVKTAGTPREMPPLDKLWVDLRAIWGELDEQTREVIKSGESGIVGDLVEMLGTVKILFVSCNADTGGEALKLGVEQRAIKEALRQGRHAERFKLADLPAATTADLRRELLEANYDIIHFSGHANKDELVFETPDHQPDYVPIAAVASLLAQHSSVKCVLLNACESVKELTSPISPVTIGMDRDISDKAAIEFSRGFYDGLAAGRGLPRSFVEGIQAVQLANEDAAGIRMIPEKQAA